MNISSETRLTVASRQLTTASPLGSDGCAISLADSQCLALCYVAAHVVLDVVDEQTAAEITGYCEEHLPG
jgi:hypothetical protein